MSIRKNEVSNEAIEQARRQGQETRINAYHWVLPLVYKSDVRYFTKKQALLFLGILGMAEIIQMVAANQLPAPTLPRGERRRLARLERAATSGITPGPAYPIPQPLQCFGSNVERSTSRSQYIQATLQATKTCSENFLDRILKERDLPALQNILEEAGTADIKIKRQKFIDLAIKEDWHEAVNLLVARGEIYPTVKQYPLIKQKITASSRYSQDFHTQSSEHVRIKWLNAILQNDELTLFKIYLKHFTSAETQRSLYAILDFKLAEIAYSVDVIDKEPEKYPYLIKQLRDGTKQPFSLQSPSLGSSAIWSHLSKDGIIEKDPYLCEWTYISAILDNNKPLLEEFNKLAIPFHSRLGQQRDLLGKMLEALQHNDKDTFVSLLFDAHEKIFRKSAYNYPLARQLINAATQQWGATNLPVLSEYLLRLPDYYERTYENILSGPSDLASSQDSPEVKLMAAISKKYYLIAQRVLTELNVNPNYLIKNDLNKSNRTTLF